LPTEPVVSSGGWNRTSGLHVQSVALLPAVTAPESLIREEGFEPPPPDSKSGSLPVSRFPRAPRGSRTRLSGLGSPCLAARPETLVNRSRKRDRGFEPRSPGWKPGVVPLDQSRRFRHVQAEGEGVEPSRLIARPISNRVPSPFGLPFRFPRSLHASIRSLRTKAPAEGVEPPIVALTGRRLTVRPHRYFSRDGRI
jgi:hypothetical protein